jgi:DNA-directed RNA polymerase subunit beta
MSTNTIRDFSKKRGEADPVPDLMKVQQEAYDRFLQLRKDPAERDPRLGLEALLREIFPIESYDMAMKLEYLRYRLEEPRYTPEECRELRLTYGRPLRVTVRLSKGEGEPVTEEDIYLGDIPIMMGGGEFIVNGAERVIVSQLHRSPGVDFSVASRVGDRPLHSSRIIPERGSWIELEVNKRDMLAMRIDQSTKLAATTFLRALDDKYSTTERILEEFYEIEDLPVKKVLPTHYAAEPIVIAETGEELCRVGAPIGDAIKSIMESGLKSMRVIADPADPLILNTLAEEKLDFLAEVTEHEAALLKIYGRLRPGNPPQVDKARKLFEEKFFDDSRYRLGRVGRFRINRKFEHDAKYRKVGEEMQRIRAEDFLAVIRFILDLRGQAKDRFVDDIDHLGNRRLRTLDELATEEMRKGFLKLKRTVQERMSVKEPGEIGKIADLVNSKSISSAIEFFFGRSELSQVVDQTNPLSTLVHERRLSALGPGGLNRKRAGFEVRDVHISHYGRICPIETPEGTNIGLIASLGIYAEIDDYGFLQTPYREVKGGKVTGRISKLRADEELKHILAPSDAMDAQGKIANVRNDKMEKVLARRRTDKDESNDVDLVLVEPDEVQFVDISPKQIVGVSASLIPFLEHDDANRALMGSNMQRQAVPLVKSDPPCVATGMERVVGTHSGMIVKALRGGQVTYVDGERIIIDNADEYVLRKFAGLNERTCQNQRPVVKPGQ